MNTRHVYFHYSAQGELLYVGWSWQPSVRQDQHTKLSTWWPLVDRIEWIGPYDYDEARAIERSLIEDFDPPHNWMFTPAWTAPGGNKRRPALTA